MARKPTKKAARLPNGSYAYRGRAVSFSDLPKREQARFRSVWARKAAASREASIVKREQGSAKEKRAARGWLKRRTDAIPKKGKESQYAGMRSPEEIAKLAPARVILSIRDLQRKANRAWKRQGRKGGGKAGKIADQIRDALGAELAAVMPQLWWYH